MKPYSPPILTIVFSILGSLTLLYGVWAALKTPLMAEKAFTLLSAIVGSAIQFGCGQAISFLARTAHANEEMLKLMTRQQAPQARPVPGQM